MCSLQAAYELKNGKVVNQENMLLDPFVFRWDKSVEHDDMNSNYSYLLLDTGRAASWPEETEIYSAENVLNLPWGA